MQCPKYEGNDYNLNLGLLIILSYHVFGILGEVILQNRPYKTGHLTTMKCTLFYLSYCHNSIVEWVSTNIQMTRGIILGRGGWVRIKICITNNYFLCWVWYVLITCLVSYKKWTNWRQIDHFRPIYLTTLEELNNQSIYDRWYQTFIQSQNNATWDWQDFHIVFSYISHVQYDIDIVIDMNNVMINWGKKSYFILYNFVLSE